METIPLVAAGNVTRAASSTLIPRFRGVSLGSVAAIRKPIARDADKCVKNVTACGALQLTIATRSPITLWPLTNRKSYGRWNGSD